MRKLMLFPDLHVQGIPIRPQAASRPDISALPANGGTYADVHAPAHADCLYGPVRHIFFRNLDTLSSDIGVFPAVFRIKQMDILSAVMVE